MRRHIRSILYRVAAPTALCAAVATAQVEVSWTATAAPWRQLVGASVSVYCPPTQTPGGVVWGSTFYTDDSSVCLAAVHALTHFDHVRGGTVYFAMEPGLPSYTGGGVRGVTARPYGPWGGSFRIVGAYAGLTPAEITDTSPMEVTWHTTALHWRALDGAQRVVQCPSARMGGLVWGRDVYADSSAICAAAVHAGLIRLAYGGGVTLRIEPGRDSYPGVTRNGVRSDKTDSVEGSFSFPKEQVRVARLTQGHDAMPTGREVAERIVEFSFAETVRAEPPPPPPPPQEPTGEYVLTWNVNARAWRGQPGRVFTMHCPPGGAPGTIWGAGEYTDDSSVCTAAVHALTTFDFERGGTVLVTMTAGRDEYPAELRRGLSSEPWARYESSFRVVGGVPGVQPNQVRDSTVAEISWATTAQHLRGKTGERRFVCPSDPQLFAVWGNDVYADQSSICVAALHAGVITTAGGPVTVKLEPGRRSYAAAKRNGIATQVYGAGQGSFSVSDIRKKEEPVNR